MHFSVVLCLVGLMICDVLSAMPEGQAELDAIAVVFEAE
jgi:hypothetical protein